MCGPQNGSCMAGDQTTHSPLAIFRNERSNYLYDMHDNDDATLQHCNMHEVELSGKKPVL